MAPLFDLQVELRDRQRAILRALVEEHVETSHPVSSTTVVRRSGLGVSSATIRNELALLEELRLIEQPHTSAGRVPADLGYRVYVDDLPPQTSTAPMTREQVQRELSQSDLTLRDLLTRACRALSTLTGYTALVMIPTVTRDTMRHLQLGTIDPDSVLVLFVTVSGRTEHRLHRLESGYVSSARLAKINRFLNELLCGRTLPEIRALDAEEAQTCQAVDPAAEQILALVCDTIPDDESREVLVEGVVCLLAQPEFHSAAVARPVLEVLEEPARVAELMASVLEDETPQVVIGNEHELASVRQCSFVGARYEVRGEVVGGLGVLGPRRMRYSETLPLVQTISEELSESAASG